MAQDTHAKIKKLKKELGPDLFILAHHYQSDGVATHAHKTGDSLELARQVALSQAKHIVFCGVHFMAESAAVLARQGQHAYIPDPDASCVMADMAPTSVAEGVLRRLDDSGRQIIPLTYVNSSAAIKALVGERGGTVCTSANAPDVLHWCLGRGDAVLFMPDKNLALNTADKLGIGPEKRHMLDITHLGRQVDLDAAQKAQLLVWPGCCAIHARFKPVMVDIVRLRDPDAKVIVHPECPPEVVHKADFDGSTSRLIAYCREAPEGAVIYVATEINLVERLARQYAGVKTIRPLAESACSNMAKITPEKLLATLQGIKKGTAQPVAVSGREAEMGRLALERMLDVTG